MNVSDSNRDSSINEMFQARSYPEDDHPALIECISCFEEFSGSAFKQVCRKCVQDLNRTKVRFEAFVHVQPLLVALSKWVEACTDEECTDRIEGQVNKIARLVSRKSLVRRGNQ